MCPCFVPTSSTTGASSRGVVRRDEPGRGRQRLNPGGRRQTVAFGWRGARGRDLASPSARAAFGAPPGHYDPARSWLTDEAANGFDEKRGPDAVKRRGGAPRGAPASRHEAGSSPALPEMGPIARRATGAAIRASASRRSAPLFFGRRRKREGEPGPHLNRANRIGCLTSESGTGI